MPRRGLALCVLVVAGLAAGFEGVAHARDPSPFDKLAGRWVGEGRLGMRDGQNESVKCRVTYFVSETGDELKQTIRCASPGGSVEVQSLIAHNAGALKGAWKEVVRNWNGEVSGNVTPTGFRVTVKGSDLSANMDLIVREGRQVVEIQFHDSVIIGLTLVLTKG